MGTRPAEPEEGGGGGGVGAARITDTVGTITSDTGGAECGVVAELVNPSAVPGAGDDDDESGGAGGIVIAGEAVRGGMGDGAREPPPPPSTVESMLLNKPSFSSCGSMCRSTNRTKAASDSVECVGEEKSG